MFKVASTDMYKYRACIRIICNRYKCVLWFCFIRHFFQPSSTAESKSLSRNVTVVNWGKDAGMSSGRLLVAYIPAHNSPIKHTGVSGFRSLTMTGLFCILSTFHRHNNPKGVCYSKITSSICRIHWVHVIKKALFGSSSLLRQIYIL